MNQLPRNRLDDTLNAILIAVGVAAMLTLAIDTQRHEPTLARAPVVQTTAAVATSPAGEVVASVQAPSAR